MKKVDAWETIDGQVFTDARQAAAHEAEARVRKAVIAWVEAHCYNGMRPDDVASLICDYAVELREALQCSSK